MGSGRGRRNCGDFCEKFSRTVVIGINILFFCAGVIILGFALNLILGSGISQLGAIQRAFLRGLRIEIVAAILGFCAAIIILTSIAGVVGAYKQWRKMLIFYAATMFLVLSIQLAMGFYLNTLDPSAFEAYWHEASVATRDDIQTSLGCCGWKVNSDTVPYPDCKYPGWDPPAASCELRAKQFIQQYTVPAAVAAITIAFAELAAMFGTCGLIYTSKDLKPGDDWFGD